MRINVSSCPLGCLKTSDEPNNPEDIDMEEIMGNEEDETDDIDSEQKPMMTQQTSQAKQIQIVRV